MSDLDISVAHNEARLGGTLAYIEAGASPAFLNIYGTTKPAPGGAPGASPLVSIQLASPAGTIASNQLSLAAENLTDMVMNSGGAVWGRILNGDGNWVLDATCGAVGSGKPIILSDTTLFSGGVVSLISAILT